MYLTHKCWDVAVCYMHAGQSLKIKCPSYYAYGGERRYGHFDNIIPPDSTLTFELDVLECGGSIDEINAMNKKAGNRANKVIPVSNMLKKGDGKGDKGTSKKIAIAKQKIKTLKKTVEKHKKEVKKENKKIVDHENDIIQGTGED